jgi:hypothetical protein
LVSCRAIHSAVEWGVTLLQLARVNLSILRHFTVL